MSQSNPSAQISRLEDEIGGQLFERNTRNVRLTEGGYKALPIAKALLSQSKELSLAIRQKVNQSSDFIFLGDDTQAVADGTLRALMRASRMDHTWHLRPRPRPEKGWLVGLLEGLVDVVFLNRPPVKEARVQYELVSSCPLIFAVPYSSPLSTAATIHPAILNGETMIVPTEERIGASARHVRDFLANEAAQAIYLDGHDDWATLLEITKLTGLIAIIPKAATALGDDQLHFKEFQSCDLCLLYYMAWRSDEKRKHVLDFVTSIIEAQEIN